MPSPKEIMKYKYSKLSKDDSQVHLQGLIDDIQKEKDNNDQYLDHTGGTVPSSDFGGSSSLYNSSEGWNYKRDINLSAPLLQNSINSSPLLGRMGHASSYSCIVVLLNTILGAGVLGLPYAFYRTGYIFGLSALIICCCLSNFGLHLLSCSAKKVMKYPSDNGSQALMRIVTPSSFYTVTKAALPSMVYLVDCAVAVKCIGVATSYLIVIGDNLPLAASNLGIPAGHILSGRSFYICGGFFFGGGLGFLPNLSALKCTNTIAVTLVIVLTSLVAVGAYTCEEYINIEETDNCDAGGPLVPFKLDKDTLKVLSIFIFGFTCHQNVFTVVNELKKNKQIRVDSVIRRSTGSACFLYCIIAFFGYYTFRSGWEASDSNILTRYPETFKWTLVRIAIATLVMFSYPLQLHPARSSMMTIVKSITDREPTETEFNVRFIGFTLVFLGTTLSLALTVEDLTLVLAMVGATGSTTVSYILPGIIYWKLFPEPHWKRNFAILLTMFGCCTVPFCVYCILS